MRWTAALAAVGVACAAVAAAAPRIEEVKRQRDAREQAQRSAREAAERARVAADQEPVRGLLAAAGDDRRWTPARRRTTRARLLRALEGAIVADARRRVARNEMDGPVTEAHCRPLVHTHGGTGDETDLRARVGRYECLAAQRDVRLGGRAVARMGTPYVAALDFRRASYVLCRHHPPPGEGGVMLAQVPLHPSCMGAASRAELRALGIFENPRD